MRPDCPSSSPSLAERTQAATAAARARIDAAPAWLPSVAGGLVVGTLLGLLVLWGDGDRTSKPSLADLAASIDDDESPASQQIAAERLAAINDRLDALRDGSVKSRSQTATGTMTASVQPTGLEAFAESPTSSAPPSPRDELIGALVDAELPNITSEERAIWIESLAGLSLRDARGVLLMRNRLGRGTMPKSIASDWTPPHLAGLPAADAASDAPIAEGARKLSEADRPAPLNAKLLNASPLRGQTATHAAWQEAADVARRNLDRHDCLGHLAEYVLLAESEDGESVVVIDRRLHDEPGPALLTNRPLDVALEAPAMLRVRREDTIYLTRYGRLAIEDDRLGVRLPSGFAPLDPPVMIDPCLRGDEAVSFDPARDGVLLAGESELATLPVWTVPDVGALKRGGAALYQPTPESGQPSRMDSVRMRSRHLTGSNVAPQIEADRLADLQHRLSGTLPLAAGPPPAMR